MHLNIIHLVDQQGCTNTNTNENTNTDANKDTNTDANKYTKTNIGSLEWSFRPGHNLLKVHLNLIHLTNKDAT